MVLHQVGLVYWKRIKIENAQDVKELFCRKLLNQNDTKNKQYFPRWDKGDLSAFYYFTGDHFRSLIRELDVSLDK